MGTCMFAVGAILLSPLWLAVCTAKEESGDLTAGVVEYHGMSDQLVLELWTGHPVMAVPG